jgi:acyl dehydratase
MPTSTAKIPIVPANAGDALVSVERNITQDQINAYSSVSGDNNPLHFDAEFAATTRFGGIIAHGMLTLALVSEMMAASYGTHWLTTGGLKVRFRGAAHPGNQLQSIGSVTKVESEGNESTITCNVSVRNSDDATQILTGTATVVVPLGSV